MIIKIIMERLEINLNILHYCIYRAHYKSHLLFKKINPANLIHKLPFQKRKYEELGIDIQKEIDKTFGDKRFGLSTMVAGAVLLSIMFFWIFAVTNIALTIIRGRAVLCGSYFIAFGLLSFLICYLFVFKKDKYLLHFRNFEQWSKSESRKYGWLSFAFILAIFILVCVSVTWSK